jgi:aryl-alcohol dehydrogenase-like predicted oxidoreductase
VNRFGFLVRGEIRSLAEGALRFVLSNPLVSTVIPGIKTPAQIEEAARAANGRGYLDPEALVRIAEIQESLDA